MKNPLKGTFGHRATEFAIIVGLLLASTLGIGRAISWLTYSAESDAEAKTEIVQP